MASFQVHQDQENQLANNARNVKGNIRGKGPSIQKRSVLGLINSNNSRIPTRQNDPKGGVQEAGKSTSILSVLADGGACDNRKISEKVQTRSTSSSIASGLVLRGGKKLESGASCTVTSAPQPDSVKHVSSVAICRVEEKLDLSSNITAVPRQPLKDITLFGSQNEEEPMSEGSIIETDSPMYVDRSMTLTPSSLPAKEPKHTYPNIYDLEEYRDEIYTYLLEAEKRHRPKPCYMRRQPDVTYSMRTVLVDWLVEVGEEYKLQSETLYLAVSFIDRFLSLMSVVRGKLQLLGTAAMFIASKYEEIYPPDVGEFVYITDDTYSKKQVLRMEHLILKVLTFDLSVPTSLAFLQHLAVTCGLSEKTLHLAMYVCELSLLEGDPYLQFAPSLLASSAIAIARHCMEYEDVWSEELIKASSYNIKELTLCMSHLNDSHAKGRSLPQQAVYDKYKTNKWHNASEIPHRQLNVEHGVILDL